MLITCELTPQKERSSCWLYLKVTRVISIELVFIKYGSNLLEKLKWETDKNVTIKNVVIKENVRAAEQK